MERAGTHTAEETRTRENTLTMPIGEDGTARMPVHEFKPEWATHLHLSEGEGTAAFGWVDGPNGEKQANIFVSGAEPGTEVEVCWDRHTADSR